MTKTAYIFPGQGSQYVGMGKDAAGQLPGVRELFSRADSLLGFSLSRICFEGPDGELKQTKNTQPAIFLHSIAVWSAVRPSDASMVAGHSLGEYSALVAAGALTFDDGLRLVRLRGELMQQAGVEQPGTMAAVIGLSPKEIGEITCEASGKAGTVQAANFNSPGQIVISGSVAGVKLAMEMSKSHGAKLVKELPVSGAFHSPLMESAKEGLEAALKNVAIHDAAVPVYANVTAKPVTKADEIRTLLVDQLTKPVRWEESVAAMAADGAGRFIEVGPGKVLQGLVKRIVPNCGTAGIDTAGDIASFKR